MPITKRKTLIFHKNQLTFNIKIRMHVSSKQKKDSKTKSYNYSEYILLVTISILKINNNKYFALTPFVLTQRCMYRSNF